MHFYLLIITWYALTFKLSAEFMRCAFHLWFLLIFYDDVYSGKFRRHVWVAGRLSLSCVFTLAFEVRIENTCPTVGIFIASSLPHVACGVGRRPARASSMVQHTFRCRQTKPEINILFAVCRVLNWCGRSICIFRDQLWKSGTRIRYQNFNGIVWVILWFFFGRFLALILSNCTATAKCSFTKHNALRARL